MTSLYAKLIGIAAIAAVIAFLGLALKVQTARLDAAKADYQACKTRYDTALGQIADQNAAILSGKKAADEAIAKAKAASEKAAKGRVATQTEQARLAASAPAIKAIPAAECPAGKAVETIRQGLVK